MRKRQRLVVMSASPGVRKENRHGQPRYPHRCNIAPRDRALTDPDAAGFAQTERVDGVNALRFGDDTSNHLLRISFDPYRILARDILKWFAQQTIKAELLAPLSQEPPANSCSTLQPSS